MAFILLDVGEFTSNTFFNTMGNVNFYLKKPEPMTGRSPIILQYEYHRKMLTFSIKQNIEPRLWDKKKQRVKNNRLTTADAKQISSSTELILR